MKFFSLFAFARATHRARRSSRTRDRRTLPQLESLEQRRLLSANVISGFVYNDANNNGIKDPGEVAIAGNTIALYDAQHNLVATTVTDANGFYQFATDPRINTAPHTETQTINFNNMPTNWSSTQTVKQFDPSLGTLTSVEVINNDPITSDIKVENMDSAAALITAQVQGSMTLTGIGLSGFTTNLSADKSFNASAFDGTIDFGGTSGHDFGPQTASGSKSITLTDATDLAAYTGTGTVSLTEQATGSSTVSGSANILASIQTTASSQVTVIYTYVPNNGLAPGVYTVVQPNDPPGFVDGQTTSGNVTPIPHSVGTNSIQVTLQNGVPSTNNNFGEVQPAKLSGYVYVDNNDNGVKDTGEPGIGGVTLTLTGQDDTGAAISLTATTAADGSYSFSNLRPGTYAITEPPVPGYMDGQATIGSQGGAAAPDHLTNIVVTPATNGVNNNFGHVQAASLSGFVYADANNNGVKDAAEAGIAGVTLTLTGKDDQGNAVNLTQSSAADGSYSFTNLRPGTYTITENGPPAGYIDGQATIGSQGGTAGLEKLSNITLTSGTSGVNNNFGELQPNSLSGYSYVDVNHNGAMDTGDLGIQGIAIKLTGTDDRGNAVALVQVTAADGSYSFTNLRPGTYTLSEVGMANGSSMTFRDGTDTIGTQGGTPGNDQFTNIVLTQNVNGTSNDFGELPPPPPPPPPNVTPTPVPYTPPTTPSKQSYIFFF
jgi:protocatechuate 3,4-dioxygenase beta subunit